MVVKYKSEVFHGFSSTLQSRISKNIALLLILHPWKCLRIGWMGSEQPDLLQGALGLDHL